MCCLKWPWTLYVVARLTSACVEETGLLQCHSCWLTVVHTGAVAAHPERRCCHGPEVTTTYYDASHVRIALASSGTTYSLQALSIGTPESKRSVTGLLCNIQLPIVRIDCR
jgi:hypothetical protein